MTERAETDRGEIAWFMTGSTEEVADILAEFAKELRQGELTLWRGPRKLHLRPESQLRMEVEAVNHPGRWTGLQIRLEWT